MGSLYGTRTRPAGVPLDMRPAILLRTVAVVAAAGLVVLWVLLAVRGPGLPGEAGGPVPDAAMPPVLLGVAIFSALALAAAVAALRDAPLVVTLCGAIGLVPVGLYTLLLPWPYRLIGLLDAALVVVGVLLLRRSGDPSAAP